MNRFAWMPIALALLFVAILVSVWWDNAERHDAETLKRKTEAAEEQAKRACWPVCYPAMVQFAHDGACYCTNRFICKVDGNGKRDCTDPGLPEVRR